MLFKRMNKEGVLRLEFWESEESSPLKKFDMMAVVWPSYGRHMDPSKNQMRNHMPLQSSLSLSLSLSLALALSLSRSPPPAAFLPARPPFKNDHHTTIFFCTLEKEKPFPGSCGLKPSLSLPLSLNLYSPPSFHLSPFIHPPSS